MRLVHPGVGTLGRGLVQVGGAQVKRKGGGEDAVRTEYLPGVSVHAY